MKDFWTKKEFEVAWSLLQEEASSRDFSFPFYSEKLVPFLIEHGLAGYVYRNLKDQNLETDLHLKKEFFAQRQKNMLLKIEAGLLADQCAEKGLNTTLLKGMALLELVYKSLGDRHMADIDFLIDEAGLDVFFKLLEKNGYRFVPAKRWKANEFKYDFSKMKDGTELVVEVHTKLFYGEKEIVWNKQQSKSNENIFYLSNEDNLVHLIGHLAFQHTFTKLNWLLDISLLLKKFGPHLDWQRIECLTKKLKHTCSFVAVTWACSEFLKTPMPHLMPAFPGLKTVCLKKILTESFFWFPKRDLVRYFSVKHLTKDTFYDAIKYDLLWLFK